MPTTNADASLAERLAQRTPAPTRGGSDLSTLSRPSGNPNEGALEGLMRGGVPQLGADGSTAIFPMGLSATESLLRGVDERMYDKSEGPRGSMELGSEKLYSLQLEVNDYIESLDSRLRSVTANPNAALAKRLRDTSNVPLSFAYFRLQQKMLRLSGDLTSERERMMLNRLASALSTS